MGNKKLHCPQVCTCSSTPWSPPLFHSNAYPRKENPTNFNAMKSLEVLEWIYIYIYINISADPWKGCTSVWGYCPPLWSPPRAWSCGRRPPPSPPPGHFCLVPRSSYRKLVKTIISCSTSSKIELRKRSERNDPKTHALIQKTLALIQKTHGNWSAYSDSNTTQNILTRESRGTKSFPKLGETTPKRSRDLQWRFEELPRRCSRNKIFENLWFQSYPWWNHQFYLPEHSETSGSDFERQAIAVAWSTFAHILNSHIFKCTHLPPPQPWKRNNKWL